MKLTITLKMLNDYVLDRTVLLPITTKAPEVQDNHLRVRYNKIITKVTNTVKSHRFRVALINQALDAYLVNLSNDVFWETLTNKRV